MHPTLFEIGDFRVPSYLAALLLGFSLAAVIAWRDARTLDFSRTQYTDFVIWLLILGVAGARLMHVLFDGLLGDYINLCFDPYQLTPKEYSKDLVCAGNIDCFRASSANSEVGPICNPNDGLCYPLRDCFRVFKFWAGGLAVYGGVIASVLFVWRYAKSRGIRLAPLLDLGSYGIPLGIAIGRLGCFASGCCYGDLCRVPSVGVRFPVGSPAYRQHFEEHHELLQHSWATGVRASLEVWPTQLMESVATFLIFLFVYFGLRPMKFKGRLKSGDMMLASAALYAVARFGIEFVRADARGELFGLATSQWIAIVILILCAIFVWRRRKGESQASS